MIILEKEILNDEDDSIDNYHYYILKWNRLGKYEKLLRKKEVRLE